MSMRALLIATTALAVLMHGGACTNGDVVLPDDVTPGVIAGASASDWWLGMPPAAPGEFALDARLARYTGSFASMDTIDLCRGACRHISYGGGGLVALDHAFEGILLADLLADAAGVVETLPFPLEEDEQAGPWLLAARGAALYAAAGTRVFQRDGGAWTELPLLDAPVFSLEVDENDVLVALREAAGGLLPAPLIGDAWIISDAALTEDALVAFKPDGAPVSSADIDVPVADAFVPLRMFTRGLLAARLVGTTLDAVLVAPDGTVTTWASLGTAERVSEGSFRATVFDDGTVGVLYPGAPRDEGVGPKTVLHAAPLP